MRPRIDRRVNMTEVIAQIERKHSTYTEAIKAVMTEEGLAYAEAKSKLMSQLKWRVLTHQMNTI
jgi:hypothetical protein